MVLSQNNRSFRSQQRGGMKHKNNAPLVWITVHVCPEVVGAPFSTWEDFSEGDCLLSRTVVELLRNSLMQLGVVPDVCPKGGK